jgi:hypothetical protein
VIVLARLRTITGILIVTFGVARRRTLVVAREAAIRLATITAHQIAIVACLLVLDDPIGTLALCTASTASTASSGIATGSRGAPRSLVRNGDSITATPRETSCYGQAYHCHEGREPT